MTENKKDLAISLYRQGKSSRAVAQSVGMGVSWVLAVVREAGIVRRVGRPSA